MHIATLANRSAYEVARTLGRDYSDATQQTSFKRWIFPNENLVWKIAISDDRISASVAGCPKHGKRKGQYEEKVRASIQATSETGEQTQGDLVYRVPVLVRPEAIRMFYKTISESPQAGLARDHAIGLIQGGLLTFLGRLNQRFATNYAGAPLEIESRFYTCPTEGKLWIDIYQEKYTHKWDRHFYTFRGELIDREKPAVVSTFKCLLTGALDTGIFMREPSHQPCT